MLLVFLLQWRFANLTRKMFLTNIMVESNAVFRLPITDRGLAQFCGGRCDSNEESHKTASDTPENIFRVNFGIK